MLTMLFSVIFGLGVGYFATQDTSPVTIRMGELILEEVPVYLVALGSLLLGLLLAWIFYFARTLSSRLTIYGSESALKKAKQVVTDLEIRIRGLEAANSRMQADRSFAADFRPGANVPSK